MCASVQSIFILKRSWTTLPGARHGVAGTPCHAWTTGMQRHGDMQPLFHTELWKQRLLALNLLVFHVQVGRLIHFVQL